MKVCDKTCIFCFFPIINKYLCMAKRSLLSELHSCARTCVCVCVCVRVNVYIRSNNLIILTRLITYFSFYKKK